MMLAYGIIILGAMVAGFVQGISGFAFSMIAMSFWVWVLPPQVAAILAVFGALSGQLLATFFLRKKIPFALITPFILGALVGIPLGAWVLPLINPEWFKLLLGAFLLLSCPLSLFASRLPRITVGGKVADVIVGMVGGALGSMGGLAGIVPTLWCSFKPWTRDQFRGVIQNFNLSVLFVSMVIHVVSGHLTKDTIPLLAIMIPAMLIPTFLGIRLYHKINEIRFRQIILILLIVSGATMFFSAISQLL